jgi:hypothetical protein
LGKEESLKEDIQWVKKFAALRKEITLDLTPI